MIHVKWKLPLEVKLPLVKYIVIVPINADTGKEDVKAVTQVGGMVTEANTKALLKPITNQLYEVTLFIKYKDFVSENTTWKKRWKTTSDCSTNEVYLGMYILFSYRNIS